MLAVFAVYSKITGASLETYFLITIRVNILFYS
uniref:Uncharacterized protein n=1 Tax=Anguilla anguilla TaxID=7936 RepID=A0A0E9UXQ3_ANGAN